MSESLQKMSEESVSLKAACAALKVTPKTARMWIKSGKLVSWLKGGRRVVSRASIEQHLRPPCPGVLVAIGGTAAALATAVGA